MVNKLQNPDSPISPTANSRKSPVQISTVCNRYTITAPLCLQCKDCHWYCSRFGGNSY